MYTVISWLIELYVTMYCAWVWFSLSKYMEGEQTVDDKDKLITKLLSPWGWLGTIKDKVTSFFKGKD